MASRRTGCDAPHGQSHLNFGKNVKSIVTFAPMGVSPTTGQASRDGALRRLAVDGA